MIIMKESIFPPTLSTIHISDKLIALIFPHEGQETTYKSSVASVANMLLNKYNQNYMVINLSERRNDMHQLHKQVIDYGWPPNLAPPLERLCTICRTIDSYLSASPSNVVVLHCKGGLGRLAVVLHAYIDYCSIYNYNDEQNLDTFGMKNFYEDKLTTYVQPSQRRYIHYFAGLLSGGISINNNSLFLHQIIIRGIAGDRQLYIKIYQGMNPVYVSGVFTTSDYTRQTLVTLDPCLQLRSDVLVKCFHKNHNNNNNRYNNRNNNYGGDTFYNGGFSSCNDEEGADLVFRCQFHTCAVNNNALKLGKGDLDIACSDSSFSSHSQVEFVLSDTTYNYNRIECDPQEHNVLVSQSDVNLQRCNSYEAFNFVDEDINFNDLNINTSSEMRRTGSKSQYSSEDYQQQQYQQQHHQQQHQQYTNQYNNQLQQYNGAKNNYFESIDAEGNPVRTHITEYRDSKGRRCRTIETETFSRRCETTRNQAAIASSPATPTIPERTDVSRQAYLRNLESRSLSGLDKPVEVEVVELQPIGPGVQTLEPTNNNSILRRDQSQLREMTSTVSVPAFFTTMPRQQTQSYSKTDSSSAYQSNQLVPYQQNMSFNGTLPGSFIYQGNNTGNNGGLVTIKETWSQTINPGSKTAAASTQQQQSTTTQQHTTTTQQRQQNLQQTSASESRSVPVMVQNQDGSVTAPVNTAFFSTSFGGNNNNSNFNTLNTGNANFNTLNSNVNNNSRFNTINSAFISERPQFNQQFQQQSISQQQYNTQQQQYNNNTQRQQMRSSSQSRLFVETPANFSTISSGLVQDTGNSFTMSAADRAHYSSSVGQRLRNGSVSSVAGDGYDYVRQYPRFVKDTTNLWYKPHFSREDAIQFLKDKPAGSFLIRNSATYQGSYGLTLRVAEVPDNVVVISDNPELNLVRHFVIEQTNKGVQLKGSPDEPAFASLEAFVYQHTLTPISLPCKLVLPQGGDEVDSGAPSFGKDVLFVNTLDTESLTGPEALAKALQKTFNNNNNNKDNNKKNKDTKLPKSLLVNFTASESGITITDHKRRNFFRKQYPLNHITYLGLDNQQHKWPVADHEGNPISSGRVFGFVARKGSTNECHLFVEVSPTDDSANSLIKHITNIMLKQGRTVTTTSS